MAATFSVCILGSGTSSGVPLIGCHCPVCTSTDPRDQRLRASIYLSLNGKGLIVDTGPDFRMQCLKWQVPRVDAVFITHLHADHIFGFDDLRRFNTIQDNQTIACYAGPETLAGIQRTFPYISNQPDPQGLYRPMIDFIPVVNPVCALGAKLTPLPVRHGRVETCGLRVDFEGKSLAYIPDVHEIPEATFELLQGLDMLIINMLRLRPHPTHLTLEQSLAYVQRIGAKQTLLTHISHDLLHTEIVPLLPPTITPAHDGLTVTL